jgi:hypothetical protein
MFKISRTRKAKEPEGDSPVTGPVDPRGDELTRLRELLIAAEALTEKERRAKEAAEAAKEAAEAAKETAEALTEKERRAKEAAEAVAYTDAGAALSTSLPPMNRRLFQKKSRTENKSSYVKPMRFEKWEGFRVVMDALHTRVTGKVVRNVDIMLSTAQQTSGEYEFATQEVVFVILLAVFNMLEACGELAGVKIGQNEKTENASGGIPDKVALFNGIPVFIGEYKRPTVTFDAGSCPWLQSMRVDNNLLATILQTYSYLVTKGYMVYGFFTNYDHWVFVRRVHGNNGEEVLELTEMFDRNNALLALATFMVTVYQNAIGVQTPPQPETPPLPEPAVDDEEDQNPRANPPPPIVRRIILMPGTGMSGGQLVEGSDDGSFFSLATNVAGFQFTTSKRALGIENLSVATLPNSEVISSSDKACTLRYRDGNGRDLVWRQMDVYGLPRSSSDFALPILEKMVVAEIKAYMHLREWWGNLVPRFVTIARLFGCL